MRLWKSFTTKWTRLQVGLREIILRDLHEFHGRLALADPQRKVCSSICRIFGNFCRCCKPGGAVRTQPTLSGALQRRNFAFVTLAETGCRTERGQGSSLPGPSIPLYRRLLQAGALLVVCNTWQHSLELTLSEYSISATESFRLMPSLRNNNSNNVVRENRGKHPC